MGTKPAPQAGRIHRGVVAVLSSMTIAILMVQHGAARKAERQRSGDIGE